MAATATALPLRPDPSGVAPDGSQVYEAGRVRIELVRGDTVAEVLMTAYSDEGATLGISYSVRRGDELTADGTFITSFLRKFATPYTHTYSTPGQGTETLEWTGCWREHLAVILQTGAHGAAFAGKLGILWRHVEQSLEDWQLEFDAASEQFDTRL